MKGYPFIYLLAVSSLTGCADTIQENEPHFSIRADLGLGWAGSDAKPGVEISSIYRNDEPTKVFTPSASARDIWLQSGAYTVKIERCNQQFNGILQKLGVRLGPDHLFIISVEGRKLYTLECTTSADGEIYVMTNDLQIEPTD